MVPLRSAASVISTRAAERILGVAFPANGRHEPLRGSTTKKWPREIHTVLKCTS
jgi:hypothetical protein